MLNIDLFVETENNDGVGFEDAGAAIAVGILTRAKNLSYCENERDLRIPSF